MSGAPFNPMRKTPPPPAYIDAVGLEPEAYISVEPADGMLFLVHRECLRVSPFIRRAFEKRVNVSNADIEIRFFAPKEEADEEELEVQSQQSDPLSPVEEAEPEPEPEPEPEGEGEGEGPPDEEGEAEEEKKEELGLDGQPKVEQETIFPLDPLYAIPKPVYPPEVYTESLQNDKTVLVRFPKLKSPTLEVLVAYLYYKNRYEGKPLEARQDFTVPLQMALEMMKLAALLEC
eukprot:gene8642-6071_t